MAFGTQLKAYGGAQESANAKLQKTVEGLQAELAQLRKALDAATAENAQLQATNAAQESANAKLQQTLESVQAQLAELRAAFDAATAQNAQLKATNAAQAKEIDTLKGHLSDEPVTRATPLALAQSFRSVIDEFHATQTEGAEIGVTIKSMDLEVKGLVEATAAGTETSLVLPRVPKGIDAASLSTLRVSFGAVPVVRAEAETPVPPPQQVRLGRKRSKPS